MRLKIRSEQVIVITLFDSQQNGKLRRDPEGSLYMTSGSASVHGGYNGRRRSLYTSAELYPWATVLMGGALGAGLAAATRPPNALESRRLGAVCLALVCL